MAIKVTIDQETCIGCGVCESMAPQYFKMNMESMKAELIAEPKEEDAELLKNVAESCPTSSIKIEEE